MLLDVLGIWSTRGGGDGVDSGIHHILSGKGEEHLEGLSGDTAIMSGMDVWSKLWKTIQNTRWEIMSWCCQMGHEVCIAGNCVKSSTGPISLLIFVCSRSCSPTTETEIY